MNNYFKVLISCIFCTLILSACSNSPSTSSNLSAENESQIKEITQSYLAEINSGIFATKLYRSKFSPNLSIEELTFTQPQAQDLMNANMTHMTFEIYGVKQAAESFDNIFNKNVTANCLVDVSVIDIENSLKKINNPLLGYSDLIKLLPTSDRTSIMKKSIAIQLAYDEKVGKWEIIDNSQLTKLIIDPYKKMTLPNPVGDPDTIIDEFIQSVRSMDMDRIRELAGVDLVKDEYNISYSELLKGLEGIDLEAMKQILPYTQIEVIPDSDLLPGGEMYYLPGQVKVPLRISFPNIRADLKNLGRQATTEEIVELLEKKQNSKRIVFDEQILHVQYTSDNQFWRIVELSDEKYGVFKFIVRNVHDSIYN